jgi:hypothetical protein
MRLFSVKVDAIRRKGRQEDEDVHLSKLRDVEVDIKATMPFLSSKKRQARILKAVRSFAPSSVVPLLEVGRFDLLFVHQTRIMQFP